ncbi:MAG: hypothetical protein IJ788_00835 [Oscillospiraceae bacterium]|nr:hypothetical protein [Oscillospiraceae bacterium]
MKKDVRLYNVIFPWWLLPAVGVFFSPLAGIGLIALVALVDWAFDTLVLWLSMKKRGIERRKEIYRAVWWKIWLIGFAADFVGVVFMTLVSALLSCGYSLQTPLGNLLGDSGNGIMYNAFRSPLSFLVVLIAVAIAGVIIYLADERVLSSAKGLKFREAEKIARALAIITAPWTFFIPTFWF